MSALKEVTKVELKSLSNQKLPSVDYINSHSQFIGARYLRECCMKLNTSIVTMCTAATYYHKFFACVHFEDYDPYLIACTSIYLASKVKNSDLKIRDIINVGYHTLHRKNVPLSLDPYFELRDSLVETELLLMRMLNFDLDVDLPHKYLLFFLNSLKDWLGEIVFEKIPIIYASWSALLDSYHVPVVLDFSPPLIAATVIYLTLQIYGVKVPGSKDLTEFPWFTYLHPDCKVADVLTLTSKLISCYGEDNNLKFL